MLFRSILHLGKFMEYKVIDNFLPKPYFEAIKDRITDQSFWWNYKKDITYPQQKHSNFQNWSDKGDEEIDFNSYGLDHFVLNEGNVLNDSMFEFLTGFFGTLMDISNRSQISKCRIDMTLYTKSKYKHIPHVDLFADHTVTIFYVIDSDGEKIGRAHV